MNNCQKCGHIGYDSETNSFYCSLSHRDNTLQDNGCKEWKEMKSLDDIKQWLLQEEECN